MTPRRMPLSARVTDILREATDTRGLTQTALGTASGLGQSQISRLFSGRAQLKVDELDALCAALDLSILDVISSAQRA